MSFQQILQSGARAQFNALGDFLFIEKAAGVVIITTQSGGYYELTQGAQVKSDRVSGLITVENKGEAGEIRIKTGFGEYVPPERETVAVSSLPAMQIAAGQSLAVSSLPKVQIEAGQSLAVSSLPKVQIAAGQSLAVSSLPKMQIAAGQSLAVSSLPEVQVSSLPAVELKKSASLAAGVHAMPYAIAANAERKKIIIKALSSNAQAVTVAGAYPLEAGEKLELETTAEIQLTGDAANSVALLEM